MILKNKKTRIFVLGIVSLTCFVLLCVNAFTYTYKIVSLSKKEKELTIKLNELKELKESLDNEIEKLHDPEYIERFAREEYLYTKPNEYVIKVQDEYVYNAKELEKTLDDVNKLSKTRIYIVISSLGVVIGLALFARTKRS